eukprot:2054749-Prymnesium_polylepis.1
MTRLELRSTLSCQLKGPATSHSGAAQSDPFRPLHVWRFYPHVPEKKVTDRTPSALQVPLDLATSTRGA